MNTLPDYLSFPAAELASRSKIHLDILPDPPALFQRMAEDIANEIEANNQAGRATSIILPVGPVGQYPLLAELCNQKGISWREVHVFQMDEYCDGHGQRIPRDHPLSFRSYLWQNLFSRLDAPLRIPPAQVLCPDPNRLNEFSKAIDRAGGVNTCYGGIGINGHVAFNDPPDPALRLTPEQFRIAPTRLVTLPMESVVMNSIRYAGGDIVNFPRQAVTIGMNDIYAAGRIRMYCPGGMWQRAVLRRALFEEPQVACPITLLRDHPDFAILATEDTAAPVIYAL